MLKEHDTVDAVDAVDTVDAVDAVDADKEQYLKQYCEYVNSVTVTMHAKN